MGVEYVIITPAYNEDKYIERTIEGVLKQTVRPRKWVIVDDGSTDYTGEIIQRYACMHPEIEYLRRNKVEGQSYYCSNVYAIMDGYSAVKSEEYDYLAVLDADISLPDDYYEQIFKRFDQDDKLGVASGIYMDLIDGKLVKVLNDRRSTPKAIQVFRRKCFEHIGGYVPLKYGGEDTCSCVMARMKGWKSFSFEDVCVVHNKPIGTGHASNMVKIRFRNGINQYFLGEHPLFMFLKSLRRCVKERPYLIGGLARMAGYVYGGLKREERQISDETLRFIRREQVRRIFNFNKVM